MRTLILSIILSLLMSINTNAGLLKIPALVDIGDIPVGSSKHVPFSIVNPTNKTILIDNMYFEIDFSPYIYQQTEIGLFGWQIQSIYPPRILSPGDSCMLTWRCYSNSVDSISQKGYLTGKIIIFHRYEGENITYLDTLYYRGRAVEVNKFFTTDEKVYEYYSCPELMDGSFSWYGAINVLNKTKDNYFIDSIKYEKTGQNYEPKGLLLKDILNINELADLPFKLLPGSRVRYGYQFIARQFGVNKLKVLFYCHKENDTSVIIMPDSSETKIRQSPEAYFSLNDAVIQINVGKYFSAENVNIRSCSNEVLYLDSVTYSEKWPREDISFSFKWGSLPFQIDAGLSFMGTTNFFARYAGRTDGEIIGHFRKPNGELITRYRYLQTDIKGTGNIEENINFNENNITIYPNPAENFCKIRLPEVELKNKSVIILSDIFGNKIFQSDVEKNDFLIDLSNYESGLYLIKLVTTTKIYVNKLLIIK